MSNRKYYDSELEALNTALIEMGQAAADAVENALQALCAVDTAAAAEVVKGDTRINHMERDIEHRCMTLLLRQQPVASDLRQVTAALKVITDLERIGDHAADIAEIVPHLGRMNQSSEPALNEAVQMGRNAHQMILNALDAFVRQDEAAAREVIASDDVVDDAFDAIKRMLGQKLAHDPDEVDSVMDLLIVIKYLERIADHSVNLAEWVQFVRTGKNKNEDIV